MASIRRSIPLWGLGALAWALPMAAQEAEPEPQALFEELARAKGVEKHPDPARLGTFLVSASNHLEQRWGAPAQVIILTREDLAARGYRDLTSLFDDLPGIDVARPFGDAHIKPYWRGNRNTQGDPFLVLVDGREVNDLWLREAQHVLHAFPLSAIERVEILYGPTSVLYGTNAMVGLVHIVTVANQPQEGNRTWGLVEAGDLATRTADLSHFFKRGDFRFRLSFRLSDAEVDERNADRYEYTKRAYRTDPRIWSRTFLDNSDLNLDEAPVLKTRAFQLWASHGGTEVGLSYLDRESGYGMQYARDQIQAQGLWKVPTWEAHVKHVAVLGSTLESSTTLRWREDGFDPGSWDLEAYYDPAQGSFLNRFGHWRVENQALSLTQDFDWWLSQRWSLNAGFRWESQLLQKAYDHTQGWSPIATATLPPALPDATDPGNRQRIREAAAYLQARARLTEGHILHAGVRVTRHPRFGTASTLRAGYTGRTASWAWKVLFGQAFQDPSQRTLYGGYLQAGSDPNLRPERSSTWEAALSQERPGFTQSLSLYRVRYTDTVTYLGNLGSRTVVGLDWQGSRRLGIPGLDEASLAGYFSCFLKADGEPKGNFGLTPEGDIGDLSSTKAWLELRGRRGPWQAALRARYLSPRDTVATNPIRRVPAQGTLDLTLSRQLSSRLSLRLAGENLLNRVVFHPGIHTADAGEAPGTFVTGPDGLVHWLGSGGLYDSQRGFYASLLPQPGRTFRFALVLRP